MLVFKEGEKPEYPDKNLTVGKGVGWGTDTGI